MTDIQSRLAAWGADPEEALRSRMMHDEKLYIRLLKRYAESDQLKDFKKAVENMNYEGAYFAAHHMKGSAGALSLTPVYECVEAVLDAVNAKDNAKIKENAELFLSKFEEFREIMRKSCAGTDTDN
ncbi:MAG: hypothetical protein IJ123_00525 [Blautia sp.]|nr:hypothetical protein [Blautia sp.]